MVHTLNELKPGVKVDKQTVQIDHSILFLRCTALAQREIEDITAYFAHVMMAVPTSLFRGFFMRKVDKSELGREIKKNVRNIMPDYATQFPPDSIPVIDGGWLLHFIRWKKNATYADVLGQYSSFLRTKYGMCCVLFDGYEYDSTKDHEHKRCQTGKVSASIVIAESAQVHRDQQAFFSNEKNKTNFISLLTTHLQGTGHQVEVSCGDADTLIVSSALEFAWNGQRVVAEDTDVLIMLVYHWRNCMEDIFIRKESWLSKPGEMISMKDATCQLDTTCDPEAYSDHSCMEWLWHNFCNLWSWKDVSHENVEPGTWST